MNARQLKYRTARTAVRQATVAATVEKLAAGPLEHHRVVGRHQKILRIETRRGVRPVAISLAALEGIVATVEQINARYELRLSLDHSYREMWLVDQDGKRIGKEQGHLTFAVWLDTLEEALALVTARDAPGIRTGSAAAPHAP